MSINIMKYESDVWKTADLLIGAGIKQSDFPKFMMPYFALLMVESRLIREADKLAEDIGKDDMEDFIEMFKLEGLGYNDYVVRKGKTLKDICKNDTTFDADFDSYLKSFDLETQYLLGVDKSNEEEKFLDISGTNGVLKKKRILFATVQAWSEIDLTPFNNSEITTLEEHIKRKWADISAETAGEQYTPDDIISLISELIAARIEDNGQFLTIYDATCGGGNLLFGVEDKIQETTSRPTATFGQEWNDTLYALAKIESRFRRDTQIEYGNTLTETGKFFDKSFNVAVANPPYGVDWKGYEKEIRKDETGRFVALPSISDGQFLFTQHILSKLNEEDGFAVIVHNGSTLFSGDAGSGESNIRKHFFDKDWVEAIIQMPTDEFFNTGIYTYLWVFNKNKPAERKDKVILINGSDFWEPLKKSKGKKRRQMNPENRKTIVEAFLNFEDSEYARVFDKWEFYYNKQAITLTAVDFEGKALQMPDKINRNGDVVEEKAIKLQVKTVAILDTLNKERAKSYNARTQFEVDAEKYPTLEDFYNGYFKNWIADFDYTDDAFVLIDEDGIAYDYDKKRETIVKTGKSQEKEFLGNGKILIKSKYSKATKTKPEQIEVWAELVKDRQKDYEIIPYSPVEEQNSQNIADFMAKYVTKPFEYLENTVGVELNFNKVFYKPEELPEIEELQANLLALDVELEELEKELEV
ncbi:SAM-dependent methyltransferase [Chryseobacterium suipulveris]|uniref:site-specific DNA-methyltransferase (adenine-specific) n=1 Tax=Chryseobacterium suipulveris TaxID=2929800 RepID=A0ABY4BSK7_9FLAO|nr:N-6 DNA methylase [Chryseobacterium suipulveris]UOE42135.1 SAM-dependent methyltransferase [Chryseobacterium suipulveris]